MPGTMTTSRRDYDIAVIGGGLVGSAIAWGLARLLALPPDQAA